MQHPDNTFSIAKFVTWKHFATLGVRQWVGDEIINYFVEKWCTRSRTTLGLSSFFPVKFMFQDNSACNTVYTIDQLAGDETLKRSLLRWVGRARVSFLLFEFKA